MGLRMEHQLLQSKDMLIEILIDLPVKSLMRFRCVSKGWFDFIKSETFATRYLRRDRTETLLLKRTVPPKNDDVILQDRETLLSFHDPDSPDSLVLPNLSVPPLDDAGAHECMDIFGPSNGIICLCNGNDIILCNPALREFELLAPTPFACPEEYATVNEACGFGFDVKTNSYKLVQIWAVFEREVEYPNYDRYIRVDLYNSSPNSWREIDAVVPNVNYNVGFDLLFKGAFHWLANEYINSPPMGVILSFDISTEIFRKFEFPDGKYPSLVVLNQCLALVHYDGWTSVEPDLVYIWIMKEYGVKESWTKELVIGPYVFRYPFVCWKDEWIVVESNSQLAFCALHAIECRKYQFHGLEGSFKALIFTESLLSLKGAFCCGRD